MARRTHGQSVRRHFKDQPRRSGREKLVIGCCFDHDPEGWDAPQALLPSFKNSQSGKPPESDKHADAHDELVMAV